MKNWLNSTMSFVNIALNLLKMLPAQSRINFKNFFYKIILYFIAFLVLISTYVFGAMALYYFLVPCCGQGLAALYLCLLSLFISLSLILTGIRLKSKNKKPPPQALPFFEKSLDYLPTTHDVVKTVMKAPAAVLLPVIGAVVAATYFIFFKRKH